MRTLLVSHKPKALWMSILFFSDSSVCLVVFSKSYCPYCKATKATLSGLGAQYYALELDQIGAYINPHTNKQ